MAVCRHSECHSKLKFRRLRNVAGTFCGAVTLIHAVVNRGRLIPLLTFVSTSFRQSFHERRDARTPRGVLCLDPSVRDTFKINSCAAPPSSGRRTSLRPCYNMCIQLEISRRDFFPAEPRASSGSHSGGSFILAPKEPTCFFRIDRAEHFITPHLNRNSMIALLLLLSMLPKT